MKYIALFILIFGPKYLEVFDTRLLLAPYLLFIDAKQINRLILIPFFLCVYLIFKDLIIYSNINLSECLRLIKAIYTILIIQGLIKAYSININDLYAIISIHIATIIFMALIPSFYLFIKSFVGFEKGYKPYRYFGLTLGYDIAGLITIYYILIGSFLKKTRLNSLVAFITSFLTSRLTMVISFITYSMLELIQLIRRNKFLTIFIIITIMSLFKGTLKEIYDTVLVLFGVFENSSVNITGYAFYSVSDLFEQIFIWPTEYQEWLFGFKGDLKDSGYSMIIMKYGLLGLVLSIVWYLQILKSTSTRNRKLMMYMISLLLLLNIKNEYFFTRSITEIILFIALVKDENYISPKV